MNQRDLDTLLADMSPRLHADKYVFVTVDQQLFEKIPKEIPICTFREDEGITLILNHNRADFYSIKYTDYFAWITLEVQSDLNAIGFTAAFSRLLGDAGISCNVVAAYYHDHIFVPWKDRETAMRLLNKGSEV